MTQPADLLDAESRRRQDVPLWALVVTALLCLATVAYMYAGRFVAPNDLYRRDQGKTIAYTVDMILNGRFSLPRDPIFQPATKPPLYNWLAAAFVGPTGIYDEWAHKTPSLLGSVFITVLLFVWCRRQFPDVVGRRSALLIAMLAGTIWCASRATITLMYVARPDMLQAACLIGAWIAGHAALSRATRAEATRYAVLFWIAVTLAALAKGPAAVYPIVYVLLAAPLCFGNWRRLRNLRWIPGLILLFSGVGLWLLCASLQDWPHVRDVLLGTEVGKRILESRVEGGTKPGHYALMWFISQNTIWSYLMIGGLIIGLLGTIRRLTGGDAAPEPGHGPRVVTRFFDGIGIRRTEGLFAGAAGAATLWAIVVLVCLSIPKDKRQDFLLPAYPAAAILAAYFVVFMVTRYLWARYALPLAWVVYQFDITRLVKDHTTTAAMVAAIAVVIGLVLLRRFLPRSLPWVFGLFTVGFLAFEVLTNTRLGIAKTSPEMTYVAWMFGTAVVAATLAAAYTRVRIEVPLIAFGVLLWSDALLQNTYRDIGSPAWTVVGRIDKVYLGVVDAVATKVAPNSAFKERARKAYRKSKEPTSHGTNPSVHAARFAKAAKEIVGDDKVVAIFRSKNPILSLMGRHQGSYLTRKDFEEAKWVIAERTKFPALNFTSQEAIFSGYIDVEYGHVTDDNWTIYKDRVGLYRIENGVPSVDQMISIHRWVVDWTTADANPYRSPNTGWIEGPNDPPIWTPPPGDPWGGDARNRVKGASERSENAE